MFGQDDIIHKTPYFKLTPKEHTIWHSHLQSGKDYVLTIKIRNLTSCVLGWRVRTKKKSVLEYKPVKKASCIPPYEVFDCQIVVSIRENTTKEHLQSNKVDKIQIQGTVLPNELHGDELEHALIKRTSKGQNSYVCQEENFKCHLLLEPTGPGFLPTVDPVFKHSRTEPILDRRQEDSVTHTPVASRKTAPKSISKPTVGFKACPAGSELRSLRQKAKQHDELVNQITKIMKERDEFQQKLSEQCTLNTLMWKRLSNIKEELREFQRPDSGDELKSDDYAKMFFEDFPKEKLSDYKQPTPISLSMAIGGMLFASLFYMIGKKFGT